MKRTAPTALLAAAVAFALTGCVGATAPPSDDESSGASESDSPYGGFPIPSPDPDEVIISIEGPREVEFSLNDLRTLSTVTVTIREPFVQEEHTYTGVLVDELFDLVGLSGNSLVDTIALNDYRYSDTAQALVDAGAVLAYLEDGEPIAMDRGGPVRLVFAESSPYFTQLEAWNWSLRYIREIPE
jgi:hypothetical protein